MAFQKGRSGNPGGRPRIAGAIRELAQQHSETALMRLVELMDDPDPKVAIAAANAVLDRAIGRPSGSIRLDEGDENHGPLVIITGIVRDGDEDNAKLLELRADPVAEH
ncbi:MAG: HEAT repeat domain-containing protein [Geminicoccaceae bacterium]|nr:HEAT repeat domain-containing protein [Geminicoccaceae bacterium]MCB9942998.1 HEAT repeat domain-containing protein [Geminicoccaceae bacterium]